MRSPSHPPRYHPSRDSRPPSQLATRLPISPEKENSQKRHAKPARRAPAHGPTALRVLQLGHLRSRAGPAAHLGSESVPSCLIGSFFQQPSPLPPTPLIFLSTRSCPAACKRAVFSATSKKLSFDPTSPSLYHPFLSSLLSNNPQRRGLYARSPMPLLPLFSGIHSDG